MKKFILLFVSVVILSTGCTVKSSNNDNNSTVIAGRGCCSRHGGVCGCANGTNKCCDGTLSPSCTCLKDDENIAPVE